MLYAAWMEIAKSRQNQLALADLGAGRRWTFGELMGAAREAGPTGPVFYPRGNSVDFILTVLRSWQSGGIVCPLEDTQKPPAVDSWPKECAHVKTTSGTAGAPCA